MHCPCTGLRVSFRADTEHTGAQRGAWLGLAQDTESSQLACMPAACALKPARCGNSVSDRSRLPGEQLATRRHAAHMSQLPRNALHGHGGACPQCGLHTLQANPLLGLRAPGNGRCLGPQQCAPRRRCAGSRAARPLCPPSPAQSGRSGTRWPLARHSSSACWAPAHWRRQHSAHAVHSAWGSRQATCAVSSHDVQCSETMGACMATC